MTAAWFVTVVGIATAVVVVTDVLVLVVVTLISRRPRRPPPPELFLPDGWRTWHSDGRGYSRQYRWHHGRWREIPGQRVPEAELDES